MTDTITLPRSVVEQALEALEHAEQDSADFQRINTDQTGESITTLRAALEQPRPEAGIPASVPTGWKLVPEEPTPKMVDAACQDGLSLDGRPVWKHTVDVQAEWRWKQMLAAAPQPPVVEQSDGDTVTVPRSLLGAACAAINRKQDAPRLLEQLRRYTTGDLSKPLAPGCKATKRGDHVVCDDCKSAWDANDQNPSACVPAPPVVEQEPVAWMFHAGDVWKFRWHHFNRPMGDDALKYWKPLYTHPQPRRPLTLEEIAVAFGWKKGCLPLPNELQAARTIERAHGIGGEA